MKKFYIFAFFAIMALAANAQNGAPLYITGQSAGAEAGGFTKIWDVETPDQFTYEDGVYKIHVNGLSSFTISTACGDWNTWQTEGNCYTAQYGDVPGVAAPLTLGTNNIFTPWLGDYDVVVAGDLSSITLTTNTPKPEVKVYLRGGMNSWAANDEWAFTAVSDNVYKFVCGDDQTVYANDLFKIADEGWAKINYGGDGNSILMEVETPLYHNSSNNMYFNEDWNGVCWFILDGDNSKAVFSNNKDFECPFTSAVSNITVDKNETTVYYNLQGVRVNAPESGLYIVVKGNKATKVVF